MPDKVRIQVDDLQVGMAVVELDRPWVETPFLLEGFTIGNRADISALQKYCDHVYIDPGSSSVPLKSNKSAEKKQPAPKEPLVKRLFAGKSNAVTAPVEQEVKRATVIRDKTSSMVKSCMDELAMGNAINEQELKENVTETVDSIVRNPDAMMWLTRLQKKDQHSSQHSINTCILAVTFARYIGLPTEELEKIAVGALMHDIGKLQIPTEILNKPGKLTPDERRIIHKHPLMSRNLLMSAGSYLAPAVDIAYTHHERIDGSGYPRGLRGTALTPFSRMIAIIDVYDTMTTEQVYRAELAPFECLKYLNQNKGKLFDQQLVSLFIKMIGVFPVGSVIELTDGEIGIVITSNRDDNLRPKVLVMLDSKKSPVERKIVNLARKAVDNLGRPIKIAKTLRKGDYGIDQQKLLQEGVEFTVLN